MQLGRRVCIAMDSFSCCWADVCCELKRSSGSSSSSRSSTSVREAAIYVLFSSFSKSPALAPLPLQSQEREVSGETAAAGCFTAAPARASLREGMVEGEEERMAAVNLLLLSCMHVPVPDAACASSLLAKGDADAPFVPLM